MNSIKIILVLLFGTMAQGCLSQQAHEQAMEELSMTSQQAVQEVERLEQVVQEKEAAVVQLQEEKQVIEKDKRLFEESLIGKEATVVQLEEEKKELEVTVEDQKQVNATNLEGLKRELQALYSQVSGMGGMSSTAPANFSVGIDGEMDFGDLKNGFKNIRSTLASQLGEFSQLQTQNEQLEEQMQQLEARLRHVERLKKELEEVRAARKAQEAKLAKVRNEVQTVGREIDQITKALEEQFGKSLIVTQHQDRLVLTMLGQVLFESGEAQLTPLGLDIMKQVGEVLATLPEKNIQVEGHTDNNPIYGRLQRQYPTNWELSTARATTVLRFLIEQTEMNPQDFSATGYADTRPAAANDSEEGRAQNRRVEIVLYPERVGQGKSTIATLAQ